jgi:uncharacterized protein
VRARAAAAAGAALLAALAWRALWHEPRMGVVRRLTLRLPAWPAELAGLRVALVADLHAGAPHVDEARIARVVRQVNAEVPDVIALLGDYVDPHVSFGRRVAPEAVAERLGGLRAPRGVFAVLGNHDWTNAGPRMGAALRAAGIAVLEDAAAPAGGPLHVVGFSDPRARLPNVAGALAGVPAGAAVLALSHDPDLFPSIPPRVALTVAGHTHGGQIAVPRLRRPIVPSRFGERFVRGHVIEGGRHLYVTSGIGTSAHPVRLLAPPEVVILRLEPQRPA